MLFLIMGILLLSGCTPMAHSHSLVKDISMFLVVVLVIAWLVEVFKMLKK